MLGSEMESRINQFFNDNVQLYANLTQSEQEFEALKKIFPNRQEPKII